MEDIGSPLQRARRNYTPKIALLLEKLHHLAFTSERVEPLSEEIAKVFPYLLDGERLRAFKGSVKARGPLRIGVVFSGGPAAGGHNIITGLFDALKEMNSESRLFGFLNGPMGIVDGKYKEITEEMLLLYRNQGGFDLIGSGRPKIESEEHLAKAAAVCKALDLDGLLMVGGDDSNTNAAVIANYFLSKGCKTRMLTVPKTIDGDLRCKEVAMTFGFDTACKTYAEAIGNIARDAASAGKYYHIIKLMGRSASHITLECALKTHPNFTIIGEEVAAKKQSLRQIVDEIADMVVTRSVIGKDFGVILLSEGLIEFATDMSELTREIARLNGSTDISQLSGKALATYEMLPEKVARQLFLDPDSHGNPQLSKISTDELLIDLITKELSARKEKGRYKGAFSPQAHFFGYEGRSALPTNFDANYCYTLGMTAAAVFHEGVSGYLCFAEGLNLPPSEWKVGATPIAPLLHLEERRGKKKAVIKKALVDLSGKAFQAFKNKRDGWVCSDSYLMPGPIQFVGESVLTDSIPISLALELH